MNTDRKIQTLKLVRDSLTNEKFKSGICGVLLYYCQTSIISFNEHKFLRNFLEENKPKPDNEYKEFTQNEYWIESEMVINDSVWWERMENVPETRQIRIDYLNQIIFKLMVIYDNYEK